MRSALKLCGGLFAFLRVSFMVAWLLAAMLHFRQVNWIVQLPQEVCG
jgi:hypothetical protein